MTKGKFIAFEGGEGAGKSTQAKLLVEALSKRGLNVDVTREPGGTDGAEAIRSLLLDPPGTGTARGWGAKAEALLFAAARADHVEKRILPRIKHGDWVISDRFVDSSRAYQGGAGLLGDDLITALHAIGSDGLRPDLTILLKASPKHVSERLAMRDGGESDAIGGRDLTYHNAVADAFDRYAAADPDGFAVIDATQSAQVVHENIMVKIIKKFDLT